MLKYIPNKVRFTIVVLLASVVLFIYNLTSYMLLPLHHTDIRFLENHGVLTTIALKHEALTSGVYMVPSFNWNEHNSPEDHKKFIHDVAEGPYAYMIVRPEGTKISMIRSFIVQFALFIVIIKLFAYVFLRLHDAPMLKSHLRRAVFGATLISSGVVLVGTQYVNWLHFPFMSTLLLKTIDTYIGFFIAFYFVSFFLIRPKKTK